MLRNIQVNFWESCCAIMVLGLALWQSYTAFAVINPNAFQRHSNSSQFDPITITRSYSIEDLSKQGPNCLGYIESKFDRTMANSNFSLKGELYLSNQGKVLPTQIDLEASFNTLGQLAASILRIKNEDSNATLGALNVNPIEITLFATAMGKTIQNTKISLQGPIVLEQSGDDFILDYSVAGKRIPLAFESYPIGSLLSLKLVSKENAKSSCQAQPQISLDLLEIANRIRTKVSGLFPQLSLDRIPEFPSDIFAR